MARPWLLILLLCLAVLTRVCAEPLVVLVSSERSPAYEEAAQTITDELERAGVSRQDVLAMSASDLNATTLPTPKLFIALGARAATLMTLRDSNVPLLCVLLPRNTFDRVLAQHGRKASTALSALVLDQPAGRQLDLIRLALPDARRIGLLLGPDSLAQSAELRAAMAARALGPISTQVGSGESLFPALKKVLDEADVLLAVADPQIYNSNSIQNLLLATFRAGVPMVAFSPAYVRAGALMAVHSTPAQIGRQAAGLARGVLAGRGLPANPQYPQEFSVTVNEHVARSLGLTLDATSLNDRLRQLEKTP